MPLLGRYICSLWIKHCAQKPSLFETYLSAQVILDQTATASYQILPFLAPLQSYYRSANMSRSTDQSSAANQPDFEELRFRCYERAQELLAALDGAIPKLCTMLHETLLTVSELAAPQFAWFEKHRWIATFATNDPLGRRLHEIVQDILHRLSVLRPIIDYAVHRGAPGEHWELIRRRWITFEAQVAERMLLNVDASHWRLENGHF